MDNEHSAQQPSMGAAEDQALAELEALFARARQSPPSDADLGIMLRAVHSGRSRALRVMLRLAGAALAAAAAVVATVLLIAPPGQPRAMAFTDIVNAMRTAPVVKTIHSGGHVAWIVPNHLFAWIKDGGRQAYFHNLETCEFDSWFEESGCVILSTADRWSDLGFAERQELVQLTDLERIIYEDESRGMSFEKEWIREDVLENGHRLILLRAKGGSGWHTWKYGIDAQTGRLLWSEGYGGRREYEYPNAPPGDIYDLGVPRDVRVIDGRASPELLHLRDEVLAAMKATGEYGAYRFIQIRTGKTSMIDLRVSDGRRFRRDFIPLGEERDLTLNDLRPLASRFLRQDLSDRSYTHTISDGSFDTTVYPDIEGGQPNRRVIKPRRIGSYTDTLFFEAWRRVYGLFFHAGGANQFEFLPANEYGWAGLRILSQAESVMRPRLQEDWFDPEHGYLPTRRRGLSFPEAPWQLWSDWHHEYVTSNPSPMIRCLPDAPPDGWEDEVLEWAQLRTGQWYPALIRGRELVQRADGHWVERTEPEYQDGYVTGGQIVRPNPSKQRDSLLIPAVRYTYILAEPLDDIRDEWFEIPPEWLELPVERH